jgi:hypothetical protein
MKGYCATSAYHPVKKEGEYKTILTPFRFVVCEVTSLVSVFVYCCYQSIAVFDYRLSEEPTARADLVLSNVTTKIWDVSEILTVFIALCLIRHRKHLTVLSKFSVFLCIVDVEANYVRSFTRFSDTLWDYVTKAGKCIINFETLRTLSTLTNNGAGMCWALCDGKETPDSVCVCVCV